eukprot:c16968_g1_i1.p1 GENE.c16968_g1_i1~~c16968_g1_i1.p1  ORF type:complete len:143 (+),score=35.53 c16968_g1_i1:108-536(+)
MGVYQQDFCRFTSDDQSKCGSHQAGWSKAMRVAYTAWSKPAWALGVAILCLLSANEQLLLPIHAFLSYKIWTPLSKLTFSSYLVHPSILSVLLMTHTTKFHFSVPETSTYFVGTLCFSIGCSLILFLAVERPIINMEKLYSS